MPPQIQTEVLEFRTMFNPRRAIARLEPVRQHTTFIAASLVAMFAALLLPAGVLAQSGSYAQTNIVSDGSVPAQKTDPTLINPWGVSIGPAFWIDTAGTGFSLVQDASGNKQFSVTIPPAVSTEKNGAPAGTVFNADTTVFAIPGSGSAQFLFGNLDGSIAAWNQSTAQPVTVVNNSASKAVYTDIALVKNNTGTFLLAANFAGRTVDVFDSTFKPAKLAGSFSDPNLPAGYAPFGIHTIGNNVYVTYAQPNAQGRENVGAGLGVVDQFDLNGNLLVEAIVGGNLNAPWGMALAPAGFGTLGGDLLVGNFGDGIINAYDPVSFALKGQVTDATNAPIANPGLWEIVFGAGTTSGGTAATSGDPNTLYFAAGINGEKGGLFGAITPAAPTGAGDFAITAPTANVSVNGGQTATVAVSLTGTNGFSGAVALACTGLPTGASCSFNPASVTLSGTTAANVTVAIATATPTPANPYSASRESASLRTRGVIFAGMLPLGLLGLFGFRKRLTRVRGALLLLVLSVLTIGGVAGCGGMKSTAPGTTTTSPTPLVSQVTINATSGSLTHSVVVSLTIN
ncbi:MAG TPA: TIGR03118 family protein [Acidobacteriaceae bacterium]